MDTIPRLYPQFNEVVVTPHGEGYFVAHDTDGLWLVSVTQTPRHPNRDIEGDGGASRCRHLWFKPDDVQLKKGLGCDE